MQRSARSVLRVCVALAAAATVVGATVTAGAMPAGHVRLAAGPTHARFGVKPVHPGAHVASVRSNTLSVHSSDRKGVVSPRPKVYLIFWGSQWSKDPASAAPALQAFFQGLFGPRDTWGTILTQYCEGVPTGTVTCGDAGKHIKHPTAGILGGVWFDDAAKAPNQASAAQLGAEAVAGAMHFGNTTQKPNLNAQYVVASPTGTHPDGFGIGGGFCAWHEYTTSGDVNIAFTNLPYVPDLGATACTTLQNAKPLDGYFSTETHEYAETVTDFWPARGWTGGAGEIADACVQLDAYLTLSTGRFDVQGLWSNDLNRCTTKE